MVTLTLSNRYLTISGASRKTTRLLDKITSYQVAGHRFAPSFRTKRWDGREHLFFYSKKMGYYVPSGLLEDVARALRQAGVAYKVVDQTIVRNKRRQLGWNSDVVMRDYQNAAVKAVLSGPVPGTGIIKMPTRAGKTKTAARLIRAVGLPTLFIVPSKSLLYQSHADLKSVLPDVDIGMIGDGHYDPQFITVATIQTLSKMRGARRGPGRRGHKQDSKYKELISSFDMAIVDEAHHIRGEGEWYKVVYELDCRYKVALSATVFPDSETETERGIIWLKACCGNIRIDIGVSELVERGFLMRQNVRMYKIAQPNLRGQRWSQTLWKKGINQNKYRNAVIVQLAKREVDNESRVIIVSSRLDQIATLSEMMDSIGLDHRVVTGKDDSESRESKFDGLTRGDYRLLIGTVIREGIDLPSVEVVINAEGGFDQKNTIQRQRNLTIAEGKKRAVLIDFLDETNEYFQKHSLARLDAYRAEQAFDVRIVKLSR